MRDGGEGVSSTNESRGLPAIAAWTLWGATSACLLALVPLYVTVSSRLADPSAGVPVALAEQYTITAAGHVATVFEVAAIAAFATLGALVVTRRPGNRVGWLFCAVGLLYATEWLTSSYAIGAYVVGVFPERGAIAVAWLNNWVWIPTYALLIAVLPLVYPDGRLPSPRWRPVAAGTVVAVTATSLVAAFHFGPLFNAIEPVGIANPLGVAWLRTDHWLVGASFFLLLASMVAAVVGAVVRLRRATGRTRDQLRWFAYAGSVLLVLFLAQFVVRHVLGLSDVIFETFFWTLWGVAFLGLPVATGLAILRHRLYDIDRLINRTLVYGLLSVLLLGVYALAVLVGGALLGALGVHGGGDLTVATSTLAVAALFGPARRRLQRTVDRRFNRARYDAAQAVERLAERLRAEVDADSLRDDVVASVRSALQPASVSLWVRGAER